MTAETIAISSHKGGVNKTTTSVSLAASLAKAGWQVLLADCDAQANATSMLIDLADIELDMYDVIARDAPLDEVIRTTRIANLSVLPSTLAVSRLDQELVTMHRREEQIRRHLAPALGDYDAIILDLPPNLGAVVISALCAATSLVVPTDATRWGLEAVQNFVAWSAELRRADVLTADFLGVLLTKYEESTRISRDILEELKSSDLPLFDTLIPKRTGAERMVEDGVVVGDPGANEDLTAAYFKFAGEVAQRVRDAQERRGRHRG